MMNDPAPSPPTPVSSRSPRRGSFWLDGLGKTEPSPPLRGAQRCDVAIIGGGLSGLSTAFHVRGLMAGAEVRVLEAAECARGASGRSGGFSTSLFGLTKGLTAWRFGRQRALEAHRYMEDAVRFVERLVEEHAIDCDYERRGTLHVATTPAQSRRIAAELRLAEAWGLEGLEGRGGPELAAEFPGGRFHCGVFDRQSALLNPARFTRGLLRLARGAGVIVHERSPVVAVEETASGFLVRCREGQLHAERVVFATNAYSGAFSELSAKQTPVLNHIVVTEPLSDGALASIGWRSRCGLEDARNLMHYVRLTADNRILMGGGDIGVVRGGELGEQTSEATIAHLERHLRWLFPQLEPRRHGVRLTHGWSGPVSLAADMAPVIGRLGRHGQALFAAGLMGHGVSMAPYNGLCLAELLAGRVTERTEAFFVDRRTLPWPPQAIRLPMMHIARAFMRLEDRLRWG